MWDTDERQSLIREKEEFKNGKTFDHPPIPPTWMSKYKEMFGDDSVPVEEKTYALEKSVPPLDPNDLTCQSFDAPEPGGKHEDGGLLHLTDADSKSTLGVKFCRSESGTWTSKAKALNQADKESANTFDDLESMRNGMMLSKSSDLSAAALQSTDTNKDGDDSDEDFSLKDMAAAPAVESILHGSESDEHHQDDVVDDFDLNFGHNDSVQSAINSILDLPQGERIETPDLSNFTGLLDSIDDCDVHDQERDPVTEAAVNSIPKF